MPPTDSAAAAPQATAGGVIVMKDRPGQPNKGKVFAAVHAHLDDTSRHLTDRCRGRICREDALGCRRAQFFSRSSYRLSGTVTRRDFAFERGDNVWPFKSVMVGVVV